MHVDDVSTDTASSLFSRNHALKPSRQWPRHFNSNPGRRAGAVTSRVVIVVAAITTDAAGIVVWKYTVPTPGSAASVACVIVRILVRILGGGRR